LKEKQAGSERTFLVTVAAVVDSLFSVLLPLRVARKPSLREP
jgi:hypothetical protein